ncbi:MAG: peptide chain release factor 1 [Oligoflexales bacterium]
MFDKLETIELRFQGLDDALSQPNMTGAELTKLTKERAELEPLVIAYRRYRDMQSQLMDCQEMLESDDAEMKDLAKGEALELESALKQLEYDVKIMMLPSDPADKSDVIVEIRAGTGGDEAALFAGDLLRMYGRYAERQGWKVEELSRNALALGNGVKEVVLSIKGAQVYSRLKFESGAHRVQRVPQTESQGRIHTSACTVAVLPEVEDVDIEVNPSDLRIDTYRSSGAGGQHVNTTDSAVRVTHIPTGLVAECQDGRSQHKNKEKALKVLRSRLYEHARIERESALQAERRSLVGSGDRSERIRTYNFPQGRMTDHRIQLTLYKLDAVMDGDLDEILDALGAHHTAELLKETQV